MMRYRKAMGFGVMDAKLSHRLICIKCLHFHISEDMEYKAVQCHDVDDDDDDDPALCLSENLTTEKHERQKTIEHSPYKPTNWKSLSISEALSLMEDMGEIPSHDNLLVIMLKCKKERSSACLNRMYELISNIKDAYEALGNHFVPAFVECGSIARAGQVFDKLSHRNVFSWTSLIQAHVDIGEVQQAFNLYEKMQMDNIFPNNFTFITLLRACAQMKWIGKGQELHCKIAKEGYEMDRFVGSILLDLYNKCGALDEARDIFNELPARDTVLWTALIAGYADHGLREEAFNCFQQMKVDMVAPDAGTYVCILKASSSLGALSQGQEIHFEATMTGFESNNFVGNTLVDFYAKCGQLIDAQAVFDKLPCQDAIGWNALVAGYSECKMGKEVLYCLKQMEREGRPPNVVTLSCAVKACGSLQAVDRGRGIHSHIVKKGLEGEVMVGNTLVDMYVKCSLLTEALLVFNALQARDLVSWNTIFTAYSEQGLGMTGANLLGRMKMEGFSPDHVTFICILKACGSEGAINEGFIVHSEVTRQGLERDALVGNTLVDMYAKCGFPNESQEAFKELEVHDVVSWNVLMAGYAERCRDEEVLSCFTSMQREGVPPDALTYVFVLKSLCDPGALEKGQEIHSEIAKDGLELDFHILGSLVVLYSKSGALVEARDIFDSMPHRDVVSWTALISGYAEHGHGKEALTCFQKMCRESVSPNAFTYVSSLRACSKLGDIRKGQELHSEILEKGFEKDAFVCSSLVDMYCKLCFLEEAHGWLDRLPVRDVISWTALISGYAERGLCEEALGCFQQMQLEGLFPDVVLWNVMILASSEQGHYDKACKLYLQLQEQGVSPDSSIAISILKACGNATGLGMGKKIHVQLHKAGQDGMDKLVLLALIDMYGRCGSMADALQVFDKMPSRDLAAWTTLGMGYARQGESEPLFHSIQRMRQDGIEPDGGTFLNLLTACAHAGLLNEGVLCFKAMRHDGIHPTIKHQNCLIDLFARAGQLDEAVSTAEKMPFEPDFVVWSTMLSASWKWGHVALGRRSFSSVLKSDDKSAGAFVMMFNIYSDAGMWEDAVKIHSMRTRQGEWEESWGEATELDHLWWEQLGIA